MITLDVGYSYSQVKGLDPIAFKKLRKLLSYNNDPKASYYTGGYSRPKFMIDNKGFFPTGLRKRVENFLMSNKFKIQYTSASAKPIKTVDHQFNLGEFAPYMEQITALSKTNIYDRGILAMPTGSGKSLVIALIVAKMSVRTIIVVPNLEIKKQLQSLFTTMFGTMKNIMIENIDSSKLKSATDYDLLIIDEGHHVAAKTYHNLNKSAWSGIKHRYFLTATPFRNDPEEQLLFEGIAGQIIYKLSYRKAVELGYIVPVEAYYIEIPKQKTDAYTWQQVYSELVVNNETRNNMIAELLSNLHASGVSTLCLVKEVKHGRILEHLSHFPFVHGQDEDTRHLISKFAKGKILSLIGTQGIIGEGVDTKSCEYVVIAGLGKAKSAFMQQVGRAVRTYPEKTSAKIILIKDKSHKFCTRHFAAQAAILLEEYGIVPQKLELK